MLLLAAVLTPVPAAAAALACVASRTASTFWLAAVAAESGVISVGSDCCLGSCSWCDCCCSWAPSTAGLVDGNQYRFG